MPVEYFVSTRRVYRRTVGSINLLRRAAEAIIETAWCFTNTRDIARRLEDIAFFLLLKGENRYKAKAYRNAGMALLMSRHEASDLVQTGTLTEIIGIGPATASVIAELVTTGASAFHQEVQGDYPSSLTELGDVAGLSMKQIQQLYERADIRSVADLHEAGMENQLCDLKDFGLKAQVRLLAALGEYQRGQGYHLYANVLKESATLTKTLGTIPGVAHVSMAGAMHRKLEVINELAFVLRTTKATLGVNVTRKAGLAADEVVKTCSVADMRTILHTTRTQHPRQRRG